MSAAPPLAPRKETWREALLNRRMVICVFTGFSSGLPLYLLLNLVPAWLRTEGVDLTAIALFALVQFPYTWKFLWSPLLDRYALPWLGRRRGWMLVMHIALIASIAAMGFLDPRHRDLDHRVPRGSRRVLLGLPRHRDGRVPPRAPAGRRARARQLVLRQRLPHLEPRARLARADPRRPHGVANGVRDHGAVSSPGPCDDARRRRACRNGRRPEDTARRSRRALPRVHRALGMAAGAARPALHLPLQARRQHGHRAGHAVLSRDGLQQDRHRHRRQERGPVGQRGGRAPRRPLDGQDRDQPRALAVRCRTARLDPGVCLVVDARAPRT